MSVAPFSRLGPYEVTALLGEGGMGRVYRATDTNLKRQVAIKVLPASVAADADRLARFQREAEVLAVLNHPNIAAIYGLERTADVTALVMELVEGEDLSERIARGAIPLDEALPIAKQIAEALEAAHEQDVIHRDLKPANIKVRADGTVKVLDFGLAKAAAASARGFGHTATITSPAITQGGIILGTASYMSPEQARGQHVDRRTDIWAFGVVVLEMLTGTRPFKGDTVSDAIAAVLTQEPDLSRLPPSTPPRVAELLRKCLRKDPRRRLRDIGDAVVELDDIMAGVPPSTTAAPAAPAPARSAMVPWAIATLALVAAGSSLWMSRRPAAETAPLLARVTVPLPAGATLFLGRGSSVAISPDGAHIVYPATINGRTQLYLRAIDQNSALPLPGTDGAADPFFSADGQWVGFVAGGKIKKVSLQGRTVVDIVDAPNPRGQTWAPDNSIIFTPNNAIGLFRVSADGGERQPLTTPGEGELSHRWPQVASSGKAMVYTIWNDTGFEGGRIVAQRLDGTGRTILVQGGAYGRLVELPDGRAYLVYAQADGLLAAPIDLDRLALTGAVTPINESVHANLSGGAHFAFSNSGHLVYAPGTIMEASKTLLWVDRAGKETVAAEIPDLSVLMSITRDGRRLIRLNTQGPSRDMFAHDLQTGHSRRLTNGGFHGEPVLTADESRVIYGFGLPNLNLFWRPVDGSGEEERLTTSANRQIASAVTPDGKSLLFVEFDPATSSDIWELSLSGDRKLRELVRSRFSEGNPAMSPDGKWMAYQSNETGRFEVYVTSYPAIGKPVQISSAGGVEPSWGRDSRELFYRNNDRYMVAPISSDGQGGESKLMFAGNYLSAAFYVPGRDQFLFVREDGQQGAGKSFNLVLNWFNELTAKATPR